MNIMVSVTHPPLCMSSCTHTITHTVPLSLIPPLPPHTQYEDEEEEQNEGGDEEPEVFDKPQLHKSDPMYQPALTDEDLARDPPGHRSGYVAVIGKPNAGKSSLINTLVGQKLSIVCYKPQTTRHRVVGFASSKEYQMILFDTPGIIEVKKNKLEERMMSAVVSSIQNAEAIIAVVDSKDRPQVCMMHATTPESRKPSELRNPSRNPRAGKPRAWKP